MPDAVIHPVRVFTTMVADLFHFGHVNFLREAKKLGDHLTVGLISDERAAGYKRRPIMSYDERLAVVESCRFVDAVIKVDENITNTFMEENSFSLRAYAVASEEEEKRNLTVLWKDMDRRYLVRLPYTPSISTSQIIARLDPLSRNSQPSGR